MARMTVEASCSGMRSSAARIWAGSWFRHFRQRAEPQVLSKSHRGQVGLRASPDTCSSISDAGNIASMIGLERAATDAATVVDLAKFLGIDRTRLTPTRFRLHPPPLSIQSGGGNQKPERSETRKKRNQKPEISNQKKPGAHRPRFQSVIGKTRNQKPEKTRALIDLRFNR
jgi:hypothetical protein